jgi:hypothetical protein
MGTKVALAKTDKWGAGEGEKGREEEKEIGATHGI